MKLKTGKLVVLADTGMKPEVTPPAIAVQGVLKVLWVSVWFFGWNSKLTTSPIAAVISDGLNVSPEAPTSTLCVVCAEATEVPRAKRARRRENCILSTVLIVWDGGVEMLVMGNFLKLRGRK